MVSLGILYLAEGWDIGMLRQRKAAGLAQDLTGDLQETRGWILYLLNPTVVPGAGCQACRHVALIKVQFPSAEAVGQESIS